MSSTPKCGDHLKDEEVEVNTRELLDGDAHTTAFSGDAGGNGGNGGGGGGGGDDDVGRPADSAKMSTQPVPRSWVKTKAEPKEHRHHYDVTKHKSMRGCRSCPTSSASSSRCSSCSLLAKRLRTVSSHTTAASKTLLRRLPDVLLSHVLTFLSWCDHTSMRCTSRYFGALELRSPLCLVIHRIPKGHLPACIAALVEMRPRVLHLPRRDGITNADLARLCTAWGRTPSSSSSAPASSSSSSSVAIRSLQLTLSSSRPQLAPLGQLAAGLELLHIWFSCAFCDDTSPIATAVGALLMLTSLTELWIDHRCAIPLDLSAFASAMSRLRALQINTWPQNRGQRLYPVVFPVLEKLECGCADVGRLATLSAPRLASLHLRGVVEEDGALPILSKFATLTVLRYKACDRDDRTAPPLFRGNTAAGNVGHGANHPLAQLREFSIISWALLPHFCASLTELSFRNVTVGAPPPPLTSLPSLPLAQRLDLSAWKSAFVDDLPQRSPQLTWLSIGRLPSTEAAIDAFRFAHLTLLDLHTARNAPLGEPRLSISMVRRLRNGMPALQTLLLPRVRPLIDQLLADCSARILASPLSSSSSSSSSSHSSSC
jgi:hypothetical protein